jgi:hypothetical protein
MNKNNLSFLALTASAATLACLFTAAPDSPTFLQESMDTKDFMTFIANYSKSYKTKEEYHRRQEVYLQTVRYIEHRNSKEVQELEGLTY